MGEDLNKSLQEIPRKCPMCHTVNTGSSRFCSNCCPPLRCEDFQKIEAERQAALERIRSSLSELPLVSDDYKDVLKNIVGEEKDRFI